MRSRRAYAMKCVRVCLCMLACSCSVCGMCGPSTCGVLCTPHCRSQLHKQCMPWAAVRQCLSAATFQAASLLRLAGPFRPMKAAALQAGQTHNCYDIPGIAAAAAAAAAAVAHLAADIAAAAATVATAAASAATAATAAAAAGAAAGHGNCGSRSYPGTPRTTTWPDPRMHPTL